LGERGEGSLGVPREGSERGRARPENE